MPLPKLNGYKINKEIAAGGMAQVYDATQISFNRSVIIKFLNKSLLDHHEGVSLFERESLIIAKLNHPNIVQVIEKGITEDPQPYFVMEKINGISLSEVITSAELSFTKKIDIAIQSCRGLSYAHKNNVIHRDIKPANIIIDHRGSVKILDFGMALSKLSNKSSNTEFPIMETVDYVAPEQENNSVNATIASDIFSFGMLLKKLFSRQEDYQIKANEKEVIDGSLSQLIQRCTHREPSKRYNSLNDVRDLLLGISQGSHLTKSKFIEAQKDTRDLTDKFNFLDVLRNTQYKRVYLFQKKSNNQLIVIKRQLGDTTGLKSARILSSLKHPNIVQVLAVTKNSGNLILISEYLSGGSLASQLLQDMPEQQFLTQACQICSAIHFAHQNNIQHSNLSTENVLFDASKNIKIADFGQIGEMIKNEGVRKKYHPPGQQTYSEQYDIYCMGAIFHHMLFGFPVDEKFSARTEKHSFRLQQLIDKMLATDPINRPTTAQQVLVELQKIAQSGIAKTKSFSILKSTYEKKRKAKRTNKFKLKNQDAGGSKMLAVALIASVMLIIALVIKNFL